MKINLPLLAWSMAKSRLYFTSQSWS